MQRILVPSSLSSNLSAPAIYRVSSVWPERSLLTRDAGGSNPSPGAIYFDGPGSCIAQEGESDSTQESRARVPGTKFGLVAHPDQSV